MTEPVASTEAVAPARRRAGWPFVTFMLLLMVLFIGLGIWQVERLGEKEALIADVASRLELDPVALPPQGEWVGFDPDVFNYRPVTATGHWIPSDTVLVFTSLGEAKGRFSGPGYWVLTPLALDTGGSVFVNRGFIPQTSQAAFATGGALTEDPVTVTGIGRRPEATGPFTPGTDTANRVEWVRDPARLVLLAPDIPHPIVPLTIDLPAGDAGALPQGGETEISFPNNHLGYAITWFGFAILVPVLLWFWLRRQRRAA